MTSTGRNVKAAHLGNGNFYDDMRVDIAESHRRFAELPGTPRSIRRSRVRNALRRGLVRLALRLKVHELLVVNGVRRQWFEEFCEYWAAVLGGRPFWATADFFALIHEYRKRQQHTTGLAWGDADRHIANWQSPAHLYQTLHLAAKQALHPLVSPDLWHRVPRRARILEYGCSLAPCYQCYREFYSHLDCDWVLADIPNFPFHYARYRYRNDAKATYVVIDAGDLVDPLHDAREYDVIIVSAVLEHLAEPRAIAEYLLARLKPGGLFVFDYVKSDGTGLDHPEALAQRTDCLKSILDRVDVIKGRIDDLEQSVGWTIARKRMRTD